MAFDLSSQSPYCVNGEMADFANGFGFNQFAFPYMPVPEQFSNFAFVRPTAPSLTNQFAPAGRGLSLSKRGKNNEKERIRNQAINDAFLNLQQRIPYTPPERLPKVKTIRLAVKYIRYLTDLLDQHDAAQSSDDKKAIKEERKEKSHACIKRRRANFAQIAASEIQSKNNYVDRAAAFIQSSRVSSRPDISGSQNPSITNRFHAKLLSADGHNDQ